MKPDGERLDGSREKSGSPMFGYTPTIGGFDVIALDTGRPMGFERETPREANGIAQSLNAAARTSPQALARALRG